MKKTYAIIILTFLLLYRASGEIPNGYYDNAKGKTGEELKTALNSILNTNLTRISYGDSRYILDETDRDTSNSANLILVYLGTSVESDWDGGNTWNREHVWPQSLLGVDVDNNSKNVGSDLHNLKPANPAENESRSNKYYANQTTSATYAPRNAVRGDLARILFYMVVMYESSPDLELVNRAPNIYEMALLDVLLEWHSQDPVDGFERNRNEVIYTYQHNRNPFIDHPEYVDLIWGENPPPLAPSGLSTSLISDTSATLVWKDNSMDESGFRIYQTDSLIHSTAANETTYTVAGLFPGSAYTFGVTAWNSNGESPTITIDVITLSSDTTKAVFFSEYIEGSSNNKALELVNGSPTAINLDDYLIIQNTNNGPWQSVNHSFPAGTILNPGQVWVIAYSDAEQSILAVANEVVSSTVANFNGDDVRALVQISGSDTNFIDIIGAYQDSTYSTNGWSVAGISGATQDHTLVRKSTIRSGNPDWASSAGLNSTDSEWIIYPRDTFSYLGSHTFSNKIIASGKSEIAPDDFRLFPAYPNPFNNTTHLNFELQLMNAVNIIVFDLNGKKIEEKNLGRLNAGHHDIEWNARSYVSGLYFYRIQAGESARIGKFVLLK